jgi:hypothetical protein
VRDVGVVQPKVEEFAADVSFHQPRL